MTLDYRKAAQWLIKAMSSASMDADDNICMHCLKTNSATVQSKLTGWTFCDSQCFKSAQSGNAMYQLIAAGKRGREGGDVEEEEKEEEKRKRREEEAAARRAATAREAARWHKEQQGGVFNEQVAEILKHVKNNPLFLEELTNSISLEQVEVWSRTARAFKEYINDNAAFWYHFLKNHAQKRSFFVPLYFVIDGYNVKYNQEIVLFGKWLTERVKAERISPHHKKLVTCEFILRYPQFTKEILFWQFSSLSNRIVVPKLFKWWLWWQPTRDFLLNNQSFWRILFLNGISSDEDVAPWLLRTVDKKVDFFKEVFEEFNVSSLSYSIELPDGDTFDEEAHEIVVEKDNTFDIFGKKALSDYMNEFLEYAYNHSVFEYDEEDDNTILRVETGDEANFRFGSEWVYEDNHGNEVTSGGNEDFNGYPEPMTFPSLFFDDDYRGITNFVFRIERKDM